MSLDTGIHKAFPLGEGRRLEVRVELFNPLNHPEPTGPGGNGYFQNSASGDSLNAANNQRDIQLGLKILF
jgi:hypothetical protein